MATSTWIADGAHGNLASTAANCDTIPSSGRDVLFNNASVVDCTWDLAIDCGTFTIAATPGSGYTGTITQVVDFSVISYSQAGGIFASDDIHTLSVGTDFIRSGGTITSATVRLHMTGNGTLTNSHTLSYLTIDASVILTTSLTVSTLIVNVGGNLAINSGLILTTNTGYPGQLFINSGQISGSGTLGIKLRYNGASLSLGTIFCPVEIYLIAASANQTATLSSTATLTNSLTVDSQDAIYYITLDLSASNYTLSATDITIGTRGIINGRASDIRANTYTQNGVDSVFTQGGYFRCTGEANISNGTWNVNAVARVGSLTHSDGTITVAAGMILYYDSTASLTGGTRSGVIDRWPFPSEKGDDAMLFETPKAGARF